MKEVYLVSSPTCGLCFMLKNRLTKENLVVETKHYKDDPEWFIAHSIKTLPQLVIIEDGLTTKIQGQDDIIQYLKTQ